jgi:hypothetical protein
MKPNFKNIPVTALILAAGAVAPDLIAATVNAQDNNSRVPPVTNTKEIKDGAKLHRPTLFFVFVQK